MSHAPGNSKPEISVIVPTYNDGDLLAEALKSILAQSVEGLEVIVVDDGSETPAEPLVTDAIPSALVIRQKNAGPSAARNAGLRIARAPFITFLDADDTWTPGALQRLRSTFDTAEVDVVQGQVVREVDGRTIGKPYQGFNLGACLFRRAVLDRTGPFNEAMRRSEDVELFMRLKETGARRLVIAQTTLRYRRTARDEAASQRHAIRTGVPDNWPSLLRQSLQRRRANPIPSEPATLKAAPPITVVLTVRNGRARLPKALDCLSGQTRQPADVLALVGSSDDGTLEYLRGRAGVRVSEQTGLGLAQARNQALGLCRTPLVAFYDHDDLWHPQKLELQSKALSRFHGPAACIVNFETIDQTGSEEPAAPPRLGWTPSALMAHADVFSAIGPFDPDLGLGCDTDWFDRLRRSDVPCAVAGRVLLTKTRHGGNLSSDSAQNREAMFKLIRKRRIQDRTSGGDDGHS